MNEVGWPLSAQGVQAPFLTSNGYVPCQGPLVVTPGSPDIRQRVLYAALRQNQKQQNSSHCLGVLGEAESSREVGDV